MLPQSFFNRLIASESMRFGEARVERRTGGSRVPHRRAAIAITVSGGILADLRKATVRDVSLTGVGILVDREHHISKDWILCLGAKLCTGPTSSIIRCRTMRTTPVGSTSNLIGASFTSLLAPGQQIKPGLPLTAYTWISLEGDKVEDPILELLKLDEEAA